ncbi:transposase [bacterium]|nr:transposase [bacterium]
MHDRLIGGRGVRARREAVIRRAGQADSERLHRKLQRSAARGAPNEHVFVSLSGARNKIEKWRIEYNRERPHSRLGHLTAEEFAARNQRISAIARTAWPANQATSGAAQRASTSDQNLIVFVRP